MTFEIKLRLALLAIILTALYAIFSCVTHADQPVRYELLSHSLSNVDGVVQRFSSIHDKESGQEFTCVNVYNGISCFPTGRNWK